MKHRYLFVLAIVFCISSLSAESFRGFLLTKDNYFLTGYINRIEYALTGVVIEFTNDFGDQYSIYPNLVNGFGFTKDGETFRYVSRYHEGRWLFLRALSTEGRLHLYRIPDGTKRWVDDSFLSLLPDQLPTYWLQFRGQVAFYPVRRSGFKRNLRALLADRAPALAAKIGSKGHRFRDLPKIVAAFNEQAKRSRKRL